MPAARTPGSRLAALEAAVAYDSFLAAVQAEPQDVGTEWTQLTGFVIGPQNFDTSKGPDLQIDEDGAGIDVIRGGRYAMSVNCQFIAAEGYGWFESAVEPSGLSLAEGLWPTEIAQGHTGMFVPMDIFGLSGECQPGLLTGYTAPKILDGSTITAWARFASSNGTDVCSIVAVLYATRISA